MSISRAKGLIQSYVDTQYHDVTQLQIHNHIYHTILNAHIWLRILSTTPPRNIVTQEFTWS